MKEISNIKESSFYDRCYEVARRIPYGKVTSYGAIAKYLGTAKSARMVGWAMNNSHDKNIPAHRVVNRVGLLSGKHHFAGSNLMKELLQNEGHKFEGDQLLNFNQVFWKPIDT
jgi:methylated-DNA-protein-cysteine methyltransferase-like protein